MSDNLNLINAKNTIDDEWYTPYEAIENEMKYYLKHFENKIVYCCCDRGDKSNFWNYFYNNFSNLKLKKLICTYYDPSETVYKWEYDGNTITKIPLNGNGDFRSEECLKIIDEVDIISTNPPFSLLKEFIPVLIDSGKQFLIIGNKTIFTYKSIFPYVKKNLIWIGVTKCKRFYKPDGTLSSKANGITRWFTNINHEIINKKIFTEEYSEDKYLCYDNYDAIEVGTLNNIPKNYYKPMGVPITIFDYYNPTRMEIIGMFGSHKEDLENGIIQGARTACIRKGKLKTWTGPTINQKTLFCRIIIRLKPGDDNV